MKKPATINDIYKNVIEICKVAKLHATNMLLLDDGLVALEPIQDEVKKYMITQLEYDPFTYAYYDLVDISKIHSKFRKTRSIVTHSTEKEIVDDNMVYLKIKNEGDKEFTRIPLLIENKKRENSIKKIYNGIPVEDDSYLTLKLKLVDEPNYIYTQISNKIMDDLRNKKLCEIKVPKNGSIFIASTLLGSLKKVDYLGYRIIDDNDNMTLLIKFKQTMNDYSIYTYARFLKF